MTKRASGILLHLTSLPSPYGIGDFGPEAYGFVEFLLRARQRIWQILPLNPSCAAQGNSPYASYSAFAGNPLLISPRRLVYDGMLPAHLLERTPAFDRGKVDYEAVVEYKGRLLNRAYENCRSGLEHDHDFASFCDCNAFWLEDYTLFVAIKEHFNGALWPEWPATLRDRDPEALREWKRKLHERILMEKFYQHVFFKQWLSLKSHCSQRGIQIMGDMPIYVSYDSADVWSNPDIFKLDGNKNPITVAGVPPDYFSATGQLWGNPIYEWEKMKHQQFSWWVKRIEQNLKLFDVLRLDHFRGFVAFWEVTANEENAINGHWVHAPVHDFFNTLRQRFPDLPIIAEDLGLITPDVSEAMQHFGFPGMKVLLFAFAEDLPTHPYLPHNFTSNCVAYTGTHDSNTVQGWLRREATTEDRHRLYRYLGRAVPDEAAHWELIRLGMMSVADRVIIPMQDYLGLGEEARMNLPATLNGNWKWRVLPEQLTDELAHRIAEMARTYARCEENRVY